MGLSAVALNKILLWCAVVCCTHTSHINIRDYRLQLYMKTLIILINSQNEKHLRTNYQYDGYSPPIFNVSGLAMIL